MRVGSTNGSLTFSPDNIKAAVGDMVQFQFAPANHTVTQSTFDQPCQPISLNTNNTGIFSGFMPVTASATEVPTYTVLINNTTPIWLYCSQGKHCQAGMVAVINEK
jgi:plastocyanin